MIIYLPMEPFGKQSPRSRVIQVKGRKAFAQTYNTKRNREQKELAQGYMKGELYMLGYGASDAPAFPAGGVAVEIVAVFSLAKSHHRVRSPIPMQVHVQKPDEDNVSKWIKDAGTGLLWTDDSQVAQCRTHKVIAAQGDRPGVRIQVEVIKQDWAEKIGVHIQKLSSKRLSAWGSRKQQEGRSE